ncbi:MAG: hypothetical protein M1835_006359 [Candelina submexicana]|nr:MAG: hypothetical protein M1835_006359 [Candelina submexicana]
MHLRLPRFCRKLLAHVRLGDKKRNPELMNPETILAPSGPVPNGGPRSTPPAATPLDFPHHVPAGVSTPFSEVLPRQFLELFLSLKSPADVTCEHINALNVEVSKDIALDELIPAFFVDGEPTFPLDPSREQTLNGADDPLLRWPSTTLSNGNEAPGRDIYSVRQQELSYDNDVAFRAVRRLPALPDRPPAKPVHFRKFWLNFDLMSEYWDTSKDDAGALNGQPEGYQGRRIGTGREMPERYREDAVRLFIEPVAWQFGCQIRAPTMSPRLAVQTVLFPVRHSSVVYRVPTERVRARAGNLEGPLMAVQCRPTTEFRNEGEALGEGNAEKVDLLREVAAMLLLAQERARDGKVEKRPGEGKWWTTAPRWGAKVSVDDDGDTVGNSDEITAARVGRRIPRGSSRRKRKAEQSHRTLSPGPGLWDKKVTYVQVGKNEEDDFDDIFMVSSINHHISILRLRIHPLYLQYLETGTAPPSAHSQPSNDGDNAQFPNPQAAESQQEQPWYLLKLQRSKWYDLFSAEDRVEAMKGVWGVFTWLMRGKGEEDVEMTDASDA